MVGLVADPGALAHSCRRVSVDVALGAMALLKLTMSRALQKLTMSRALLKLTMSRALLPKGSSRDQAG